LCQILDHVFSGLHIGVHLFQGFSGCLLGPTHLESGLGRHAHGQVSISIEHHCPATGRQSSYLVINIPSVPCIWVEAAIRIRVHVLLDRKFVSRLASYVIA